MNKSQRPLLIAWLIVILSLAIAAATFLIPEAAGVSKPHETHMRTAIATLAAGLFNGAAFWFMSSLKSFKSGLRFAYILLGLGLIALGIAVLQLPIVGLLNLWSSVWIDAGGVVLPFLLAVALIFAGLRKFAKLLQLKTRFTSVTIVIIGSFTFSAISLFAARHIVKYRPLDGADTYIAAVGWALIYMLFAPILASKIAKRIGAEYQPAMRRLAFTLAVFAFGGLHEYLPTYFLPETHPYIEWGAYLWPFVASALLAVWAAEGFYALTITTYIAVAPNQITADEDFFDSLTLVAALASRPEEIDPYLDDLRKITSTHQPQTPLTVEEKQRLLMVYQKLEHYLTTSDPLRNFTADDLRLRTTPGFRAALQASHS